MVMAWDVLRSLWRDELFGVRVDDFFGVIRRVLQSYSEFSVSFSELFGAFRSYSFVDEQFGQ